MDFRPISLLSQLIHFTFESCFEFLRSKPIQKWYFHLNYMNIDFSGPSISEFELHNFLIYFKYCNI